MPTQVEQVLLNLEREIVVMKLIEHPHIIRLYDVWETSTELYLVMEYVQGGELFDYLCQKGRLSTPEALGYFQQIITAISYCHRFNIAHRDLKPENLLLDEHMNIKVADFGMAAWQTDSLLETACGSPHYAAPEVIRGQAYKGSSADIWSCGVILYALLAGRLPFDDEDVAALLNKVKVGQFEIPDAIDPLAKDLIRKMLEKDVSARITIADIQTHPFYTSRVPKALDHNVPDFDGIARSISRTEVDPDILKNLCTLWHGTPEKEIIESLTTAKPNRQKAVYHLLIEYRIKHLEDYDEEEEARHRLQRKKHTSAALDVPAAAAGLTRTSSKAMDLGQPSSFLSPTSTSVRLNGDTANEGLPDFPKITRKSPTASPTQSFLMQSSTPREEPFAPTSPICQMLEALNLPPLNVPDIQDANMQHFLEEMAARLSQLQATYGCATPDSHTSTQFASFGALNTSTSPLVPIGTGSRSVDGMGATTGPLARDSVNNSHLLSAADHRSDISTGTRPLSIRRPPPILITEADKENWHNLHGPGTPGVTHKSSLRGNGDGKRQALRVHIIEPSEAQRARQSKSLHPVSPTFSDNSFTLPSIPRRSLFGNIFRFKPTSFVLFSVQDAYTSREECRRLLVGLGVRVSLFQGEGLGVLKCKLDEYKDPAGVLPVVKAMRFRVEVHKPSPLQDVAGYEVLVCLVLEKGASSSLQMVYTRLKRNWDLDTSGTPSSLSPVLTDRGRYVDNMYSI